MEGGMNFLLVFIGSGIGGALRHGVNLLTLRLGLAAFPTATFAVNLIGSFLMGMLAEFFAFRSHLPPGWMLFLTTGILGGFTTFATFSLDAGALYERGQTALALLYILGSVALSIGALFLGMLVVRAVVRV
jgi:fluoride exporter